MRTKVLFAEWLLVWTATKRLHIAAISKIMELGALWFSWLREIIHQANIRGILWELFGRIQIQNFKITFPQNILVLYFIFTWKNLSEIWQWITFFNGILFSFNLINKNFITKISKMIVSFSCINMYAITCEMQVLLISKSIQIVKLSFVCARIQA